MTIQKFSDALLQETEKVIIGKTDKIRLITAALLANGHILLEDLPGSGKTTLVKALSAALGCDFKRIQFVPDLMPADILGVKVFNQKTGDFVFNQGPVETNLLLADEINRAIPRTQSALLEAMEERQITLDGVAHPLPKPFIVLATQNPVEMESTFPLPAAQMDRFFLCLSLGYMSENEEADMLTRNASVSPVSEVKCISSPEQLVQLQAETEKIFVSDEVRHYIVKIVQATRGHASLKYGASPRASLSLYRGARCWAAMQGREYCVPEDVQAIAPAVLCHRLVLTGEAKFAGNTASAILSDIISGIDVLPSKEEALLGK